VGGEMGAAGAGGEPLVAMTFAEVEAFLDTSIAGRSTCFDCHESGGCQPKVFQKDETLYDTLTTLTISRCDNRVLVAPGDPENSALYLVLKGTCGSVGKMPSGCVEDEFTNTCADHGDIERIRLWIEAGAQR
jgi:hypothetical protein